METRDLLYQKPPGGIYSMHDMDTIVAEKEKVLDGPCNYCLQMGAFPKHLMEKFGLIHYAGIKGKTRIVIEYNNDTGEGWIRVVSESHDRVPIRKDQTDSQPCSPVYPI